MITLHLNLKPYGVLPPVPILDAQIWTVGNRHNYLFTDCNGNHLAGGSVAKEMSGHRNPLHLLRNILNDMNLDRFDRDYVTTDADL